MVENSIPQTKLENEEEKVMLIVDIHKHYNTT